MAGLIPLVGNACHLDMPNPQIGRVLTEMGTGYSKLNKYRNNIGQSLTPLCDCGEEETTEHYIQHCHIYVHERAKHAVQLKTIDESFDLLHLLTRDFNKEKHQMNRALPRTSKPCTPILSLSNSILQYKEKLHSETIKHQREKIQYSGTSSVNCDLQDQDQEKSFFYQFIMSIIMYVHHIIILHRKFAGRGRIRIQDIACTCLILPGFSNVGSIFPVVEVLVEIIL